MSKLDIEKLYKIYILNSNDKLPKETKDKTFLKGVDLEYIINIMLGRLFLIISNNNRKNKFTLLTEVAFYLGEDFINKYHYNIYSASNF